MATVRNLQKASQSRVWTIEDRSGPSHRPVYETLARVQGVSWGQGSLTPVRVPDPEQYGRFITVDTIRGQPDLPGVSLEVRMTRELSHFLTMIRKGCPIDLQIHVGLCKDPSDFDMGWEKIHVLEDASFTNYSTSELGAFDFDQENPTMETIEVMAQDYYEIKPLAIGEEAGSQVVQEVTGITICDARTCGICGIPSDGCQRVFLVQTGIGASPGLPPEVVYTQDGGLNWGESIITSLPANGVPSGVACVGPYLVVVSDTDDSIHYASIVDILGDDETWREVTTGVVGAGSPNKIASVGRGATWIVGDAGYVYFSEDITAGVSAQQAGDLTSSNLEAISVLDDQNVLVGGAANAILVTFDGGVTWSLLAGPSGQAAVSVTAGAMISNTEFLVGYADGKLFSTIDGGVNWTQKTVPGSVTRIDDIQFATRSVGYMTGSTGSAGGARLFRTVNGGYSWYALPEVGGSLPTALRFNALAACGDDPNLVWAGGIETTSGDGIVLKGA